MKHTLAVVVALLMLTGCSGTPTTPTTPTTPQAPPSPSGPPAAQEYGSVVALRDAAIAAGYACESWEQSNQVEKAAESGTCSDEDVFSTYIGDDDLAAVVDFNKAFGDASLLVGPNWIINTRDESLDDLQAGMGGTIVRSTDEADE